MDDSNDQYKHAPPSTNPYHPPSTNPYHPPPPLPPTDTAGVPITLFPPQPQIETPWSTGLCGCFDDVPNCCITCWCPCITFGQISEIIDQGSSSCATNGTVYALLMYVTGCGCLLSCYYRTKMRRQYMLKDNACGDLCVHFCCEGCALCQEYRELKIRGFDMALGWQGNLERRGMVVQMAPPAAPQGMSR